MPGDFTCLYTKIVFALAALALLNDFDRSPLTAFTEEAKNVDVGCFFRHCPTAGWKTGVAANCHGKRCIFSGSDKSCMHSSTRARHTIRGNNGVPLPPPLTFLR